jgi:cytoskeletal protein CcmA (bactofilin family)
MAEKQSSADLSFISPGTTIDGKMKTDGSVRIDGKLNGDLVASANAAIGTHGAVEGSVTAKNISLAGRMTGTLTAMEKLVLEGKSVMKGDIRAARLVIDEGALFDGECAMTPPPGQTKAG